MVSAYFKADAIALIARIFMRQRSSYPKPFKAQVVQECLQPGATISSVAIRRKPFSHGPFSGFIFEETYQKPAARLDPALQFSFIFLAAHHPALMADKTGRARQ
jgi:hypothetical protein